MEEAGSNSPAIRVKCVTGGWWLFMLFPIKWKQLMTIQPALCWTQRERNGAGMGKPQTMQTSGCLSRTNPSEQLWLDQGEAPRVHQALA